MRCASCFLLNAVEALHCSGCGHELGLEPLASGRSKLACPRCRRAFASYRGHGGLLGECEGCGGQFVEHGLLEELLERREVHRPVTRAARPRENPLSKPVQYLACPNCENLMNRNNFGTTSGIVVDVCSRHGVWFDAGELPRVLAFVEAGGLERARRLADARRAQSERERRFDARTSRVPAHSRDTDALDGASTLVDGVLALLELVTLALKNR